MTCNRLGNEPPKVEVVRVSVEEIRNDRLGGLVQEGAALTFIEDARSGGYAGVILRAHVEANAARRMYAKMGFQELPVRDSEHRDRSYWFLRF
jgi:hypothetical protein